MARELSDRSKQVLKGLLQNEGFIATIEDWIELQRIRGVAEMRASLRDGRDPFAAGRAEAYLCFLDDLINTWRADSGYSRDRAKPVQEQPDSESNLWKQQ